jgi:hypothetical protein
LRDLDTLDPQALKALIFTHHEQYIRAITSRAEEIEHLKLVVAKLQRTLFGNHEKIQRCTVGHYRRAVRLTK